MRVVLSGKEYAALKLAATQAEDRVRGNLESACMMIATRVPLDPPPWEGFGVKPWGCPHVKESQQEYCDECLARDWCPLPKNWGK